MATKANIIKVYAQADSAKKVDVIIRYHRISWESQKAQGGPGLAMNNSLAEVRPELVPEWSEKNLPLKPDEITFGSNKKVWWRGACGY